MHRSASTPALAVSRSDTEELGKALNKQHRKFYSNDIHDEQLVPLFQSWAQANWCSENVEFFLEVASYKRASAKSGHKFDMKKEADSIFHKYISLGAPQEINISYVVRVHILRCIAEPNAKVFDEAQRHILELMEVDCFPRFFRSQEFLARYRPVPDPLPPLKKTPSGGIQQQETKSRSSSLKSYFRKVLPLNTTRTTRSQSSVDDTVSPPPEPVEDVPQQTKGDSSPRSAGNSPRIRSRTMSRADEDGYLPSVRSSESPHAQGYMLLEKDKEKTSRSNSFPMRLPGVLTLRGFSRKNRRGSDASAEYYVDENGNPISPTHSPRHGGSPRLGSPRLGYDTHSAPSYSPRGGSPDTTPRGSSPAITPPHSPRSLTTPRGATSPRNVNLSLNGASPSPESPRNATSVRVSGDILIPRITLAPSSTETQTSKPKLTSSLDEPLSDHDSTPVMSPTTT